MPCLAQNPSQTAKCRESHNHTEINVMADSREGDAPVMVEDAHFEDRALRPRVLTVPVDFNNANVTEEELKARLTAFEVIRDVQAQATRRLREGPKRSKLALALYEDLLECQAVTNYRVPLCYRETDDDLAVIYNEAENALD